MDEKQKAAVRAARLIRDRPANERYDRNPIRLPEQVWSQMQRLARQIECAECRGWHQAAHHLTERLSREADLCRGRLSELAAVLRNRATSQPPPRESEVYRDIMALENEFDRVKCDFDSGELWVTTEPIVLEGIDLGRFEIRLNWDELLGPHPYRVVALDPNPAAGNRSVVHPHVQNEYLCEGEGRRSIQGALAGGRLFDFFMIVSQLLSTYARGSAYVELDNWEGIPCQDCGSPTDEDDRCYCERCDRTLCSECVVICQGCDHGCCSGCIGSCEICGEDYCTSCLASCAKCRATVCPDCLVSNICRRCHEKQEDNDEARTINSDPVVQPDGLGEAAVPAGHG